MWSGSAQTVTGICEYGKESLLYREGFVRLDDLNSCQLRKVSLLNSEPYIFAVIQVSPLA